MSIRQNDRLRTRSLVLFDVPDPDLIVYTDAPPHVVQPEECSPGRTSDAIGWEIRIVDDVDVNNADTICPPELLVWSRFADVPAEAWFHQALLAYASDGFLIGTAMRPHAGVNQALAHVSISTSVITQSLSFHRPFDASQWLLLVHRSPFAGAGRSFGRADVFTRNGDIVASYAQENMIRAFANEHAAAGEDLDLQYLLRCHGLTLSPLEHRTQGLNARVSKLGWPRAWLTLLVQTWPVGRGCPDAQDVPCGVQARLWSRSL